MKTGALASRLRSLRKKSGLTQKEMAGILGFSSAIPMARHEHSETVPNLLTALAYEIIFRVPVSLQFRELFKTIEAGVEERLLELERELEKCDAKGRGAAQTARKLVFLCARKDPALKHQWE